MANYAYNELLTRRALATIQSADDYVAQKAFHFVKQTHTKGSIPVFKIADLLRCEFGYVAPGAEFPEADLDLEWITVTLRKFGLDMPIPDEQAGDLENARMVKTDALAIKGLRYLEKLMIATVLGDASFNDLQTGVSGTPSTDQFKQFDAAGSDPISVITALKTKLRKKTGITPDSLLVTADVHDVLINHAEIIERMPTTVDRFLTEPYIARALGVKNYYVTAGVENTNNKDNATQTASVQADKKLLLYYKGAMASADATAAAKFMYDDTQGNPLSIYTYREDKREADFVRSKGRTGGLVQSADLGIVLKSAIA